MKLKMAVVLDGLLHHDLQLQASSDINSGDFGSRPVPTSWNRPALSGNVCAHPQFKTNRKMLALLCSNISPSSVNLGRNLLPGVRI